ncbi:MAG: hypothetical protein K6C35_02250 [Eubacterium sp.]|nr:hypothetical protein [Eubacterium sp.]
MKKLLIVFLIILVILGGCVIYISTYKLKAINVTGCEYSSPDQVREAVRDYAYMNNTILLYWRNKMKPIKGIPFVAKLDIEFAKKGEVNVTVYEKKISGCIEYMERFIYFDKDGIILEASGDRKEGVPYIDGLVFESWEMGKKLPIKDEEKFNYILTVTQLKEKYQIDVDGITFTPENEIVLHCGKIDIESGDGKNLAIQLMNLKSILSKLEGKAGVLYMKDYSSNDGVVSFKTREMLEAEAKKKEAEKNKKDKKDDKSSEGKDSESSEESDESDDSGHDEGSDDYDDSDYDEGSDESDDSGYDEGSDDYDDSGYDEESDDYDDSDYDDEESDDYDDSDYDDSYESGESYE